MIDWFQEVAQDKSYANPEMVRYDVGGEEEDDEEGWKLDDDFRENGGHDASFVEGNEGMISS